MEAAEKKRTLSDIVEELQQTLWQIDDAMGEVTSEVEAELDGCVDDLKEKVNSILWVCDQHEAMADKMNARAATLKAKAKAIENNRERLRQYVLRSLIQAGVDRLGTRDYPVVGVYNSPDKVEMENVDAFVEQYKTDATLCKTKVECSPIKAEIKKKLQAGEEVVGAVLLTGRKRLGVK